MNTVGPTVLLLASLLTGIAGCASSSPSPAPSVAAQGQLVGDAVARSTLPPVAATAGALVPGFPSSLLPLPPGAAVTASGVQRREDLLEISMSATTTAGVKQVLDFYAKALGRAGFSRTGGNMLPPGAVGLAFTRDGGRELLVVAVVDRGAQRSFSVGGTLAEPS